MTKIEWTDRTWNPIAGCSKVSDGCKNCYAETMAKRLTAIEQKSNEDDFWAGSGKEPRQKYEGTVDDRGLWTGKVNLDEKSLLAPLRWKKPCRVFVNSMSDLFHENVPDDWIDQIFAVMALCPQHTFQVLTKRPKRMSEYISSRLPSFGPQPELDAFMSAFFAVKSRSGINGNAFLDWPLPNILLGVSVENQKAADERIPLLLQTPAVVRFLSCEPLLGAVDLLGKEGTDSDYLMGYHDDDVSGGGAVRLPFHTPYEYQEKKIGWVIAGGESGPHARPMHPDWVRGLRDQCHAAGVPFFFKQFSQADTKACKDFESFPDDLKIREYPHGK